VFLVAGSQYVEKRVSALQHAPPVIFHLFQMGQEPSRFVRIKKAGSFVEGEDFINRQSIHLDAVRVIHVGQSRQAVDDFLI
jgi:hypothetical protein